MLPATTFLEGYDIARAYGPLSLQLGRPVVDPIGEARSNADVFGELGDRMGLLREGEPRGELDLLLRVLRELPAGIGASLEQRPPRRPAVGRGSRPVRRRAARRRRDGKVHCFPRRSSARHRSVSIDISPIPPRPRFRWR